MCATRRRTGTPFLPPKPPEGAPNVLIVLYDDTGLAAWSPFGGRINMPTLQRLADNGLTYSQWHTTALCSPTRSCLLTGRNHHQNGFALITEAAIGFPGRSGHIPMESATIGRGDARAAAGTPSGSARTTTSRSTTRRRWERSATGRSHAGFDRFYGFFGGETNNWYPDLIEDNHYVDQPYPPEEGYHLSKDLADQAIPICATQGDRAEEAVVHVVLPGRQPRPAPRRPRSGPTGTRASSTTATRPTANGPCRA